MVSHSSIIGLTDKIRRRGSNVGQNRVNVQNTDELINDLRSQKKKAHFRRPERWLTIGRDPAPT